MQIKLKNILIGTLVGILFIAFEYGVYKTTLAVLDKKVQQPQTHFPRVYTFCKTDKKVYEYNLKICMNTKNDSGYDSEYAWQCIKMARQEASNCLSMICVTGQDKLNCVSRPLICINLPDKNVMNYCKEHEFDNVVYR